MYLPSSSGGAKVELDAGTDGVTAGARSFETQGHPSSLRAGVFKKSVLKYVPFVSATENGVDVSMRLLPKIKIGQRVDIQSKLSTFNFSNMYFQDIPENAGSGIFNVYRLSHVGDSYGDAWTTKVTGYRPPRG